MGNEISASTEKVTSQVDISKVESGKIDEQVTPTIEKSDSTKEVLPTEDTSSQTDTSETALDESKTTIKMTLRTPATASYIRDYSNGGCVLWCNNRVKELLGITLPPTGTSPSGVAGASNWWYTLNYSKGNEPAKYALAIWRYTTVSGCENYGHVAFVEDVNGNVVTISQGGVYGAYWNGYSGVSYGNYSKSQVANIARTFLGYVYLRGTPIPSIKRYNVDQLSASVGQTISNGDYHIVLASNPSYGIDVAGASSKNGTNIQVYQNTMTSEQVFTISYLGSGYYKLIHKFTNKSIDVANGSRDINTNVQLWEYNGSAAQQWILKQNGLNNTFEIISRRSGLSLDVANGQIANNTNIQMYESNGSPAQQFRFISIDSDARRTLADGVYHIVSAVDENMGLDVVGAASTNNTNVQIYPNLSDSNQTFEVKYLNNGYYSITTKSSGKSLDAVGNGSYNGTNVVIYNPNNTDAQQWIIKESDTEGFFEIVSKNKNMLLDVAGGVAKAGTNVQLYVRNGSLAQKWKFIPDLVY
ncbi:RICIN domain-containing protein [Streptococcus mutans]|uniref:RICIN domain-containing protein n=1 Tax=Streptococcus mutans TaxID=1309 RepID=UPI0038B83FF4